MLSNSTGVDGSSQHQANFILPDINKLALEAKSGSLAILLVSFGMYFYVKIDWCWISFGCMSFQWLGSLYYFLAVGAQNPLRGINLSKGPMDMASLPCKTNTFFWHVAFSKVIGYIRSQKCDSSDILLQFGFLQLDSHYFIIYIPQAYICC